MWGVDMRELAHQQSSGAARTVMLVGRRLRDNENLGLAYLRASLELAGFHVELRYLNNGRDVAGIADTIMAEQPALLEYIIGE